MVRYNKYKLIRGDKAMGDTIVININQVTRPVFCPLCSKHAKVIALERVTASEHQWYRIHIECTGKCDLLWSCVDVVSL